MNKSFQLIKGDASIEMKNIPENHVDLILTDPPYGVGFKQKFYDDSKEYVFGEIGHWYKEWFRVLKESSHMFIFVPTLEIHQWIQAGINEGFVFKNIITTEAHASGGVSKPKNGFDYRTQPILHFTKGKGKELNEYDLFKTSESWLKDKRNTNPRPFTYIYPNIINKDVLFANTKSGNRKDRHPNEKNVELLKFLIGTTTEKNDIVLDSFSGSGSCVEASLELGRKVIAIEKDEYWFSKTFDKFNKEGGEEDE